MWIYKLLWPQKVFQCFACRNALLLRSLFEAITIITVDENCRTLSYDLNNATFHQRFDANIYDVTCRANLSMAANTMDGDSNISLVITDVDLCHRHPRLVYVSFSCRLNGRIYVRYRVLGHNILILFILFVIWLLRCQIFSEVLINMCDSMSCCIQITLN